MKLLTVQVENYRCILDTGVVPIDDEVTCIVGKNESGKTAFLRALHLLNPLNPIKGKKNFDTVVDFPARNYHKLKSGDQTQTPNVVTAEFDLDQDEVDTLAAEFGEGYLKSRRLTVKRGYSGSTTFDWDYDETVAVAHLLDGVQLLDAEKAPASEISTISGLLEFLKNLSEPHSSATDLRERIESWRKERLTLAVIDEHLDPWLPKFFYFDEYSTMPGRIAVDTLKAKVDSGTDLTEGEKAFEAFLALGGADLSALQAGTRTEAMFRELENAGIAITAEAMQFWTQNEGLRVQIRESQADPNDEDANLRAGQILNLRIENSAQYGVTSPFDERSRGFVWFFSFLAYFTGIEESYESRQLILLLDEPGLSLHGSAQADFLRFINERLAAKHQVIYTTHSPFLVEPDRFDRVRTVEDLPATGTTMSADIFRSTPGTSLPILTKMGVDLFQTLMVGPHTLLIEGSSDFLYLKLLSAELARRGQEPLDERWVLVPVDGIGKFDSFFRLYEANKINVAVVMDSSSNDKKLVDALKAGGRSSLVIQIGDVMGSADADIEDLLGEKFYLKLVEATYQLPQPLDTAAFTSKHPRIAKRVEQHFEEQGLNGGKFSHQAPAAYLREYRGMLASLPAANVKLARKLTDRLNSLIA